VTACVVVLALVVFFPEVAALLARWLIGTEPGRYLLLAGIVIGLGCTAGMPDFPLVVPLSWPSRRQQQLERERMPPSRR
jgi:hypothetical protein